MSPCSLAQVLPVKYQFLSFINSVFGMHSYPTWQPSWITNYDQLFLLSIFNPWRHHMKFGSHCTIFHKYPIFSTRYSVMCKVYSRYYGTSLKLGDYLSVQAHKPCSISHLAMEELPESADRRDQTNACCYNQTYLSMLPGKLQKDKISITRVHLNF